MQKIMRGVLMGIMLGAALAACSPTAGSDPTDEPPTEEPTEASQGLAGTSWVLVEIMNAAPIAGTQITLNFTETEVSGQACNSYGGSYTASDNGTFSVGDLFSTDMACTEPEGAMEQESLYFVILNRMQRYEITTDGRLILEDPLSNPCCLIFIPASEEMTEQAPLDGTSWTLTEINGTAPIAGSEITLAFAGDQATGSAGCNGFNSTYSIIGEAITFSPVISTKMFCNDPAGVMDQEAAFTAALEATGAFVQEGDRLELISADGASVLVFQQNPAIDEPVSSDLVGTEWVLVSLNGSSPLEGTQITLIFNDESTLGGHGGCNSYFGSYTNVNGAFKASELGMTAMACLDPEGVMEQEAVYHDTLSRVTGYTLEGDQLSFYSDVDGSLLVFIRKPQFDMNPADLVGTNWMLTGISETMGDVVSFTGIPEGITAPTLNFADGTVVRGFAGCRDYEATYTADGDKITFPTLTMLTETCDDEAKLLYEGDFTTMLTGTTQYRLTGDVLELYSTNGVVLQFQRMS